MNLEAIYFISQVIAAAALVASLIFVGLQIRQGRKQAEDAERTARSQAHQQIADSFLELTLEWPRRREIFHLILSRAESDDLTREQRFDLGGMLLATMKVGENAYFQHISGMLSVEQLDRWLAMSVNILGAPAASAWWSERMIDFDDGFVDHIAALTEHQRSFQDVEFYQENVRQSMKQEQTKDPAEQ